MATRVPVTQETTTAPIGMAAMRSMGTSPSPASVGVTSKSGSVTSASPAQDQRPSTVTNNSGATVPASGGTSGSGYSGGTSATSAAATSSHRKPVPDYLQSDYSGDATAAAMYASANDYNNDYTPSSSGSYGGASNSGSSANFADIIGAALGWGNNNSAGYGAGNGLGGYGGNGGGYTGGGNGGGTGGYVGTMRDAYDAQAKARADALEQLIASYDGQQAQMNQQYDQTVRDAYANARLSAIGNNELLAAQGLAGGLYQAPRSGYSETSRVMQDNALRTNVANAQLARAQASQEVARDIAQLRAQGLYEQADLAASQAEALINLQMQLDEQQYQRELDAWNMQQAERNNA